jgi:large repetitive protein
MYAINADGTEKWRVTAAGAGTADWQSAPVVGTDGTIYLGSGLNLYAYTPDGALAWKFSADAPLTVSPALAEDGTIYFAKGDIDIPESKQLVALNPDGTLKWEYSAGSFMFTSPPTIDGNGTVYIGIVGALHAVNPDGTLKWTFDDPPADVAGVAIGADGTLYFGDAVGHVYALGPGAG